METEAVCVLGSSWAVTGGRDYKPADVPVVLGQMAFTVTLEGEPLGPLLLSETEASTECRSKDCWLLPNKAAFPSSLFCFIFFLICK